MKKIMVYLLCACMLVLTACQKSGTEPAKTETVKETEGKVASENGELILATTTSTKDCWMKSFRPLKKKRDIVSALFLSVPVRP